MSALRMRRSRALQGLAYASAGTRSQQLQGIRPAWVRFGQLLLFGIYVALLAGRFTLDRLSPSLPAVDLRLIMLYCLTIGVGVWYLGAYRHIGEAVRARGLLLFLAWAGWMSLSAVWAPPGARLGEVLTDFGVKLGFVLLAVVLITRLPRHVTRQVWVWVFWTAVVYFLGAVLEGPGVQGRYSAFGGGPNVFVRIMVLGAIAAFFLTVSRGKSWFLFFVPVFAMGAALSGSRGGLLSAAIVTFVFIVPILRMLGAKRTWALLGVTVVGLVGLTLTGAGAVAEFLQERFVEQTLVERYASDRTDIAGAAVGLWAQHGVTGTGLDGYYALQSVEGQFAYPHNLFIATAAEGGTVGAVLLVVAMLVLTLTVLRRRPLEAAAFTGVLAGLFLFSASMFSGDYYDSRQVWFFLLLAVVEAGRRRIGGADDGDEDALSDGSSGRTFGRSSGRQLTGLARATRVRP